MYKYRKDLFCLRYAALSPKVDMTIQKLSCKPTYTLTLCLTLSTLLLSLLLHNDRSNYVNCTHVPDRRTRDMTKGSKEPPVCPLLKRFSVKFPPVISACIFGQNC